METDIRIRNLLVHNGLDNLKVASHTILHTAKQMLRLVLINGMHALVKIRCSGCSLNLEFC
jgi:hypothetical protein